MFVYNALISVFHPIMLHYQLIILMYVKKKIVEKRDVSYAGCFEKTNDEIKTIRRAISKHLMYQQGLETIYQLAIAVLLLCYANSNTTTSSGLSALFKQEGLRFLGLTLTPEIIVILSVTLSFFSFTSANINGIRGHCFHLPIMSRLMLALCILASCIMRIVAFTLYFAPLLGLFELLNHFKGKHKTIVNTFRSTDTILFHFIFS